MGSDDNTVFYEGMVAYKTGDFQTAIAMWTELENGSRYQDTIPFYLAMAHLGLGQFDRAKTYLDKSDAVQPVKQLWYSALIALKAGDVVTATDILEQIPQSETHYYEQSRAILEEIGQ
jgi:tetratricopeptide (TPR) repeat protein